MKRAFKSYDKAKEVGEAMKKEIGYVNFRAKSIKSEGEGEDQKIQIKGYASTKDRDRYGDIVEPSAFEKTMENYMENPMLLLQHDPNKQIGVVTDYELDSKGLFIDGDVKYTAGDEELFDKITNGDLKGFSIGFRIKDLELLEEETDEGTLYTWIIKELELLEISVVTIPANPYTLMKSLDDMLTKSAEGIEDANLTEVGSNSDEDPETDPKTEEDTDEGKTEDPETEVEGGDEEPEVEPETAEDEEPEEKDDEGSESKEIDNDEEESNIDESESDEPENDPETDDDSETPDGDDDKEKTEGNFTLKMIEKIVGAKTEALEKQFEAKEKNLRETLEKEFAEKMKAFETENVKMLEGLFDIIKSHGVQIKQVAEGAKNLSSGKGFIYSEVKKKDPAEGRDKEILATFQNIKNNLS